MPIDPTDFGAKGDGVTDDTSAFQRAADYPGRLEQLRSQQRMSDEELWSSLEGIYAYDMGAVDSGIRDEGLRSRCIAQVATMSIGDFRLSLSRWVRDTQLSEDRLAQGYGWEDVLEFLRWIDQGMQP